MPYHGETREGGGSLLNTGAFLAAGSFKSTEAGMVRGTQSLTARAFGITGARGLTRSLDVASPKLASRFAEKGALTLAKTHGVFGRAGWAAAQKTGLTKQFAKIAMSRAAGMYMVGFNVAMFAPLIYSGVRGTLNTLRDIGQRAGRLEFGRGYRDTRGSYTERQRSVAAITSSRMSTRAAIGGEAMLMHR